MTHPSGDAIRVSPNEKKAQVTNLPTLYQSQIHKTRYSRWIEEENRRENWDETVDRYLDAMEKQVIDIRGEGISELLEIREAILSLEVMPSMRALMTAGKALERDNVAGYNCAYLAVNRPQAFDEALYILCCGTGVGFSVERQYTNSLPEVPEPLYPSDTTIVVRDSKIGWASALRQLIHLLYSGVIPRWDVSKIRPAGSRLKTFGGRASGPGPLEDLFRYVVTTFEGAQGRKLSSLECHGIMCKVGDVVVVGGVRRSALISLSNPSDDRMRDAKAGKWWDLHPEYALANNSAAWTEKPSMERFIDEWISLIKSKSGERGIINRAGLKAIAARNGRRDAEHEFGTNPCSEIILRDRQFCNLSEVVVRHKDNLQDLARKVRLATILGTIQATFTDFRYLSAQWKRNCEEERLLGVSLTGIMDHPFLSGGTDELGMFDYSLEEILQDLRQVAVDTNLEWSGMLGINPAAAITCVKPSGTVSQLVDASSGIHARWSDYYVRTNRASKNDPVAQFLYIQGIPAEDELLHPDTTWVFSYPIKAPETSVTRHDITSLDQLNLWLTYQEHWCEHKPSITVYVRDHEWLEVGAFVYKHFDKMSGVSFLPHTEHTYKQPPYQDIDRERYEQLMAEMPESLDWSLLSDYEAEDSTEGVKELACVGVSCEIA